MNGDGYSRDGGGRSGSSRQYTDHRDRDRDRDRVDRDDRGGDRDRRRRRSRSPRQTSRRDRDYEVDTYSSSRDYRERERENNYARRDHRRDDRNWSDSYSRRDRPRHDRDRDRDRDREDMRGPPRRGDRDRDYDDRGRGGRRDGGFGGGGGGSGGGARERKKSASPPVKKREPTPDLDGYVSIQVRPRRMTQWDIKPAGYDNITAEQAKLSGMFPLPGAPRAAPMDPTKLAAFVNPATGTANSAGLQPLNAKQAKRLFVYNLPSNVTSSELVDFFNLQLNGLNVVSGNNPCLSASLSHDKQYASVEFKAPEDATVALAMDGISMQSHDSLPDAEGLSIRRPKDYITPATEENPPPVDHLSSTVNDSPYKLSISQIPVYVEEDQVRELVETFGKLRSFVLVKDTGSETHRGIAFCEYEDRSTIDDVIAGLNSIPLGDSNLKVTRATVGVTQQIGIDGGVNAISVLASTSAAEDQDRSRVVCLLNMVTADELLNDQEYEDIQEEVREECEKHGRILDMKIPRPAGVRTTAGVGKIYIKYDTPDSAQKAIQALAGRQFARRTVVATEFSEESFDVDAW